jgi:hypothetical protein
MRVAVLFAATSAVELATEHGSVSSPISALQSEMSMLEGEIKRTGKITPGVYETIKKLQTMVESIIEPAILESHAVDQMLIHKVFAEIAECDALYAKFKNGAMKQAEVALLSVKTKYDHCGGSLEERKQKYAECLDQRDLLVQANNTKCCAAHAMCPNPSGYGDCEIVKLEQGFVGCNYREKTGDECYAHAKKLIGSLTGFFTAQDKQYEIARAECEKFEAGTKAKIAECAYLQQSVNALVAEINDIGNLATEKGDEMVTESKQQCDEYKKCRVAKIEQYLEIVGPCAAGDYGSSGASDYGSGGACVKNREADRHKEWDATQTIKCMLDHYCQGGKFDQELVDTCKQSITVDHLVLEYPVLPAELPCEVPVCPDCPGCDDCLDRPYYQYLTPCYSPPMPEVPVCVEQGECPDWCGQTEE